MDVVLEPDDALQQRFVEAIFHVSELSLSRTSLGADVAVEDLVATLQQRGDKWLYRRQAAARLLALRGRAAAGAAPALLECMRMPVLRPERTYSLQHWGFGEVRCRIGPENHRWHALALTQIVPETEAAMEAHGYLARHGTPVEFAHAMAALRLRASKATEAVPHLIAIVQESDAVPRAASTIRETVITLGILGERAVAAQPTLERVAAGPDPHLAALAADALRKIAK